MGSGTVVCAGDLK